MNRFHWGDAHRPIVIDEDGNENEALDRWEFAVITREGFYGRFQIMDRVFDDRDAFIQAAATEMQGLASDMKASPEAPIWLKQMEGSALARVLLDGLLIPLGMLAASKAPR